MTPEDKKLKVRRALRAVAIGVVLALVCRALPPEIQGPCEAILKICTGNL